MKGSPGSALADTARLGIGVGVGVAVLVALGSAVLVAVPVAVGVGVTTANGPEVAIRVKESFAKRRSSYVPGPTGAANTQLPLGRGATGAGPQETYCHAM
ncbi:MAG TPA: hypothetical protein VG370_03160 [Chloroflexota bacterium]|nr:hypothetical protein [Chloroflexota bacterium]